MPGRAHRDGVPDAGRAFGQRRPALTHEHLLQRVWGPDKGEDSGPVRNIVKRLRRKLGDDASNPAHIFAEHRVGYRMEKGQEEPEA